MLNKKILIFFIIGSLLPKLCFGSAPKIYSGNVTRIIGTQVEFSDNRGVYYTVQTQGTTLTRRYGAPMLTEEIIPGDKIQVTGTVRPDNNIAAILVRDMSLYAHNSTFSGKIITVNSLCNYIIIDSRQWGTQTIHINSFTVFKKNTVSSTITDLTAGMTVTVKGAWERTGKDVNATSVQAIIRLVAIDITGELVMRGDTSLTIIANNTIYGIDLTHAQLQNKKGQPIVVYQFGMDDTLHVWGKHITGSTEIVASKVKDTTK
jgi:hypothetical protein